MNWTGRDRFSMTHSESIIKFLNTEELISTTLYPQAPFLGLVYKMVDSEAMQCHFCPISVVRSKSPSSPHGLKKLHSSWRRRECQRVLKLSQSTQWPQIIYSPLTCKICIPFQTLIPLKVPSNYRMKSKSRIFTSKVGSDVKESPWVDFLQCTSLGTVTLNL